MSDAKVQLEYAPRVPRHRRRRFRRIAYVALVLAVISPSIWWRKTIVGRIAILNWQRQCMIYTALPDQLAYDSQTESGWSGSTFFDPLDGSFRTAPPLKRSPRPLNDSFAWPTDYPSATLFMHQRRSANGSSRLVIVELRPIGLLVNVLEPGNVVKDPHVVWADRPGYGAVLTGSVEYRPVLLMVERAHGADANKAAKRIRIYAGQPDPADSAHFTIAFTIGDQFGVIDGRLNTDDTVSLEVRHMDRLLKALDHPSPATVPAAGH